MSKVRTVVDYVILRNIMPCGRTKLDCPRGRPLRVATLLDEASFMESKQLQHNKNVFLEDYVHDWNIAEDKLLYYSRVRVHEDEGNDVILVYEFSEPEAP